MENVKFGEFRLGSVINIFSSKAPINKNALQSSDLGGDIPYVTRSTSNNGVSDYIKRYLDDKTYLNDARQITIAMDTYVMYYQSKAFYTGNRVKVGVPTVEGYSDNMAEYLITAFNKSVAAFSWGHNMDADQLEAIKITLPTLDEDTPDWEYMDNYIKDVKARKQYKLTEFIEKDISKGPEYRSQQESGFLDLDKVRFEERNVQHIFEEIARGTRHIKSEREPGDIAYLSTIETNNGIIERISNPRNLQKANRLVYTTFGYAYYMNEDFSMSDEVTSFYRQGLNERHYLYLATCFNKHREKYGFDNKATGKKIEQINLTVPITKDGDLALKYMENVINTIKRRKASALNVWDYGCEKLPSNN